MVRSSGGRGSTRDDRRPLDTGGASWQIALPGWVAAACHAGPDAGSGEASGAGSIDASSDTITTAGSTDASATVATPLRHLPANWTLPSFQIAPELPRLPIGHQSLEPPEFSWVGETGRHIGTVVHAALEAFASAPELPARSRIESDRDSYLHQLRRHGVPDRDLPRAARVNPTPSNMSP